MAAMGQQLLARMWDRAVTVGRSQMATVRGLALVAVPVATPETAVTAVTSANHPAFLEVGAVVALGMAWFLLSLMRLPWLLAAAAVSGLQGKGPTDHPAAVAQAAQRAVAGP